MKILGLAMLTALVVAPTASGQTAPAPATTTQPGTIESARKLLDIMHIDRSYDRIFEPLTGLMAASILPLIEKDARLPPNVRAELGTNEGKGRVAKIVRDEFFASIRARYGKMKEATAKEYAADFTEDELRAIIAFYSSGTGAKALALVPQISAKMQAYGQIVGKEAGEEAYRHILDRLDTTRGT